MSFRILVSNDDGIDAPGIRALAKALESLGDVWVVAPDRERSAVSHGISLHSPLRIIPRDEAGRYFAVDGTPADAVYLALNQILDGPPDIVVSGINLGPNLGTDVLYSGTVAAAMEGALFGFRALATSLCLPDNASERRSLDWNKPARVAAEVAQALLAQPVNDGVVLNLNIPTGEPKGIKLCRLGFTDWQDAVSRCEDPRGRPYYWIGGERRGFDPIEDSDTNGIAAGFATLTPIHYDLTDHRSFAKVRTLKLPSLPWQGDHLAEGPLDIPIHPRLERRQGQG